MKSVHAPCFRDRRLSQGPIGLVRLAAIACCLLAAQDVVAQAPPTLDSVFPAGGRAGQVVDLTIGGNVAGVNSLHCSVSGTTCERIDSNRFRLAIPANAPLGLCDLWESGDHGVSGPRTFAIGARAELLETEPNDEHAAATPVPLDATVNGIVDKAGDEDLFRFEASQGQRVVVECWAERIDSRIRAMLEIYDDKGRRLAVNRGFFGIDPLIDFAVPITGAYFVKVHDLTTSASAEHFYRLDIGVGPRVAFTVPSVIERGQASRVAIYGWNLHGASEPSTPPAGDAEAGLERVEVELFASLAEPVWPLRIGLQPSQVVLADAAFPYLFPGSQTPIAIGIVDAPVVLDEADNHLPATAQAISAPCEVSGRLTAGDECDWYAIEARRGELFYLEAFGQRIQSPVDLQIGVYDLSESNEPAEPLIRFADESRNLGETLPTAHLDPAGRWVAPKDGRYGIAVRNLIGGLRSDPRRTYRLSVRREEADFRVVAAPRSDGPAGLNVRRGGREALDLIALRQRGFAGAIRVSARDLPPGVECPDVWIGPNVDRATLIVSADPHAPASTGELNLEATAETPGMNRQQHAVRAGTIVRGGTPTGWGRIASCQPLAVVGEAPLRIVADGHEILDHHLYGKLSVRHAPGGVLDVAIEVERRDAAHQAAVKLMGVGLPEAITNQTSLIPAGSNRGWISFYLPPTLAVGRYSLAVRAETTIPAANNTTESVQVVSNLVVFDVQPAAFVVDVDPFAIRRARRGETIQIAYSAKRVNGFIGKMHTELASPGYITNVVGLRGRGETFVGQTDRGSLQIVVNDDAPLGPQPFLRLFTVGVVEDEPVYQGASLMPLEIVE